MPEQPAARGPAQVRLVRPETLTVADAVLNLPLAEPWRRLAAMVLDLLVIGLMSVLSGPFLGIATGVMLMVLFGNRSGAPAALLVSRWTCRVAGAVVILIASLALGHSNWLRTGQLRLAALQGDGRIAAERQDVAVPPHASPGQLARAVDELDGQVTALKAELKRLRADSHSLTGQALAVSGALGLTFGWAGVYFTLMAGTCNGRTLGKLALRTRAAKINGSAFTYFDGFVRQGGYVAGLAMGLLGFVKLLWEPNRQAVQDRMAATVVVRD